MKIGQKVKHIGHSWVSGVPSGETGVVTSGSFGGIYTDPSKTLIAVQWDTIGLRGVKKSELEILK